MLRWFFYKFRSNCINLGHIIVKSTILPTSRSRRFAFGKEFWWRRGRGQRSRISLWRGDKVRRQIARCSLNVVDLHVFSHYITSWGIPSSPYFLIFSNFLLFFSSFKAFCRSLSSSSCLCNISCRRRSFSAIDSDSFVVWSEPDRSSGAPVTNLSWKIAF